MNMNDVKSSAIYNEKKNKMQICFILAVLKLIH